jgi:hypothetical protein
VNRINLGEKRIGSLMRNLRTSLFVTMLGFAAVAGVFLAMRPHEPVYDGRRFSDWLLWFGSGITYTEDMLAEREAAIAAMGTNTLAFLVRELQAKDSWWKEELNGLFSKQSFVRVYFIPGWRRRERAVRALEYLGSVATPIVPTVRKMLRDPELGNDARAAFEAISVPCEDFVTIVSPPN